MSGLVATLVHHVGDLQLDVSIAADAGQVVALMGPNAAGKTTALRLLAGLATSHGRIELDGRVLADDATRIALPAEQRSVGFVFQDLMLFPHMSARDNVAFGLRSRGLRRTVAAEKADAVLADMGITHRAHARPHELSGGEAQRVALARAIAPKPRLLLLDEPFAAVDAQQRAPLRAELRRQLALFDGVTVLVTHDAVDALVLADHVVVIEHGREVASGTPRELARRPRTPYVASLFGLNLLKGIATGTSVRLPAGDVLTIGESHDGEVLLTFPPHAVSVHEHRPDGSPRNVWLAEVAGLEHHGEVVRIGTAGHPEVLADVTRASAEEMGLRPGSRVWLAVKATEIGVDSA